ncbi:hypothetical protein TRVL_04280 [Trypanosoma vivax]|nr:hypothetical protein TRVL_04280 [Trypanosoma vivax]
MHGPGVKDRQVIKGFLCAVSCVAGALLEKRCSCTLYASAPCNELRCHFLLRLSLPLSLNPQRALMICLCSKPHEWCLMLRRQLTADVNDGPEGPHSFCLPNLILFLTVAPSRVPHTQLWLSFLRKFSLVRSPLQAIQGYVGARFPLCEAAELCQVTAYIGNTSRSIHLCPRFSRLASFHFLTHASGMKASITW